MGGSCSLYLGGMRLARRPVWRLVAFLALVLLSVSFWWATLADHSTWLRYRHVYSRGVTTTASVLTYKYDAEGGDPDGWTTDRVTFMTQAGSRVTAVVGHHSPGPELTTRTLRVTYDPLHPDVVFAAYADVSPTDGSEWWDGFLFAVPATFAAVVLAVSSFMAFRRAGIRAE
jgi:hypothetical protein